MLELIEQQTLGDHSIHRHRRRVERLLMFQDSGVTGLPLTPDGNNVQIVISANGWFTL